MSEKPKQSRRRSFPVKPEALLLLEKTMREKGFTYSTQEQMYEELWERTGRTISIDTVKNFFNPQFGRRPQRNTIQALATTLGLMPEDLVEGWTTPTVSKAASLNTSTVTIDPSIFQRMLDKKIRESTANIFLSGNLRSAKLYVLLGLIERKEKPKHREVTPENGSSLYRANEYEISRKFENDQFLTEVLLEGNSPKSQGKRIAIIGEPGSGKSTRMQQIAMWLIEQSAENYVIWISLADIRGYSLEDFLLKKWLKEALNQRETCEDDQDELVKIFNQGNVWLLLDGIDEMGLSENPLAWINRQICGWLDQAKIISTCRINVWDSNRQALNQFDVYRNLDFSDDQQNEFITKFLDDHKLSEGLINELGQLGKERISDLVKNPLRLTLICRSWQKRQGSLPDTKAGLYQECVEAYYDWKEEPKTTKAQRKELNKALGELAKQALERDDFRFRLTEAQITEVLGESDEGLFKLALDVGWLNKIGESEENYQEIYAFLHPSFQEYFAALSIESFDFFFSHHPEDIDKGVYKIFDKQWIEVIEYWFCRNDIPEKIKITCLNNLLSFKESWKPFYFYYHTHFLVFKIVTLCNIDDLNFQEKIFKELIKWLLKDASVDNLMICPIIRDSAAKVIINYSSDYIKSYLSKLFHENLDDEFRQLELSEILLTLGFVDNQLVNFLHKLCKYQNSDNDCYIYDSDLGEILISRKASILLQDFCLERKDTQLILISCWEENLITDNKSIYWAQEILKLQPNHKLSQKRLSESKYPIREFKLPYIESACDNFVKANHINDVNLVFSTFGDLRWNYELCYDIRINRDSIFKPNDYHWKEYKLLVIDCFKRNDVRNKLAFILDLKFRLAIISSYYDHYGDHPQFISNEDILIFQESDYDYEDYIEDAIFTAKMLNLSDEPNENALNIVLNIYNSLSTQLDKLGEKEELLLLELLFYLALNSSINYEYYRKILTKIACVDFNSVTFESVKYSNVDYFNWEMNQKRVRELINSVCTKHPACLNETVTILSEKLSYFDEVKIQELPESLQEYKIFIYSILWDCSEKLSYKSFYNSLYKSNHQDNINKLRNFNLQKGNFYEILISTENLNQITDSLVLLKRFKRRFLQSIPAEIKPQLQAFINSQYQTGDINSDDLIDQIEEIILAIRDELQVDELNLFLDNKNPSQLLLDLRDQFSDLVNIEWNR